MADRDDGGSSSKGAGGRLHFVPPYLQVGHLRQHHSHDDDVPSCPHKPLLSAVVIFINTIICTFEFSRWYAKCILFSLHCSFNFSFILPVMLTQP